MDQLQGGVQRVLRRATERIGMNAVASMMSSLRLVEAPGVDGRAKLPPVSQQPTADRCRQGRRQGSSFEADSNIVHSSTTTTTTTTSTAASRGRSRHWVIHSNNRPWQVSRPSSSSPSYVHECQPNPAYPKRIANCKRHPTLTTPKQILAIGFLLVILSSALFKDYLTLLVVATYVVAPIPNWICGKAQSQDDFMDSGSNGVVELGRFMTGFLVVMGIGKYFFHCPNHYVVVHNVGADS